MRVFTVSAFLLQCGLTSAIADGKILFDFEEDLAPGRIVQRDVKAVRFEKGQGSVLRVATGLGQTWPGFDLLPAEASWDLSGYLYVALDVRNAGQNTVMLYCRVDSPDSDGTKDCSVESITLAPGEQGTLYNYLNENKPGWINVELQGIRGNPWNIPVPWLKPGEGTLDAGTVTKLVIFVSNPKVEHVLEIDNIRAIGERPLRTEKLKDSAHFFPFIDEFGQYKHRDWKGKTHVREDLVEQQRLEAGDLEANPGPSDWNRYGGWAQGPQFKATGFFYPKKHGGKWWLVDPEGRLFFSHGINAVRWNELTPVDEREGWFDGLPKRDSAFKDCFVEADEVLYLEYKGKRPMAFNFGRANLYRKYGPEWKADVMAVAHRRLRSWGLNTVGNWSEPEICLQKKTPYVVPIWYPKVKVLEGSAGYWSKFPDVFDMEFRKTLKTWMIKEAGKSPGDPWCIGYFIDNELSWGDSYGLAEATLASPAGQAAKQAFVEDLKLKYGPVEKLNEAWGTSHASWSVLEAYTVPPGRDKAGADLEAFNRKLVETYFKSCRDIVKEVAPDNLYLGCRFSDVNDTVAQIAAGHCDVVSYNLYRRSVAGFRLPSGLDAPVMIGEFHFGALDRGLFHPGLIPVADQNERGKAYKDYLEGALANPLIVGCHWFQYMDQPASGRALDGENFQIGFVDICDTPYPETRAACRGIGYGLYSRRTGN